jgi:hypothetical protein
MDLSHRQEMEGIALAKDQRRYMTAEENAWLDKQEELLKMGIRIAFTEQDTAIAISINRKMNMVRYGKCDAFKKLLEQQP